MLINNLTLHEFSLLVLDNTAPNDPYASYLLWPHLSFVGTFRADVSTVNNIVSNYNPNKTRKDPSWNPKGSGEWSVNALVTQMCFANGTCSAPDRDEIPVTGTNKEFFYYIMVIVRYTEANIFFPFVKFDWLRVADLASSSEISEAYYLR